MKKVVRYPLVEPENRVQPAAGEAVAAGRLARGRSVASGLLRGGRAVSLREPDLTSTPSLEPTL